MKKTLVAASAVGIVAGSVLIASPSFAHTPDFVKNCKGITFSLLNYSVKPEVSHVVHHDAVYGEKPLISAAVPAVEEVSHIVKHEAVYGDAPLISEATPEVPEVSHVVKHEAVTHEEIVTPAYDEKVIDVEAQPAQEAVYGDAPLISAAYDEKIIDQAYVPGTPAVPAQPAVYGPKPVISPAVPAIPAVPAKPAVTHVEYQWVKKNIWGQTTATTWVKEGQKPSGSGWIKTNDCRTIVDQAAVPAIPAVPAKPAVYGDAPLITPAVPAKPAVPEVPEVSHVVKHEAVYGEKPLITPAKPAIEEVSHIVKHEAVTKTVTDVEAYDEKVIDQEFVPAKEAVYGEKPLLVAAYDEKVIDVKAQPAVDAVYGDAPLITPASDETVVDQKADAEPNTVSWIAGGQHGAAQFGESFSKTISFEDTTKANTYTVDVVAWDDPTGVKGWTTQWTGMTEACPTTPPTEEPTPPVTTPPTDEPSTPTPTDEPSDNPTKPAVVAPVVDDNTPKGPRHRAEAVVIPQADQAKTLAYTGSEGMEQGLIGAGVLLAAGATLFGINRKRRRSN